MSFGENTNMFVACASGEGQMKNPEGKMSVSGRKEGYMHTSGITCRIHQNTKYWVLFPWGGGGFSKACFFFFSYNIFLSFFLSLFLFWSYTWQFLFFLHFLVSVWLGRGGGVGVGRGCPWG